ncbi:MAG: hypothetical protein ABSC50_13080, partial [Candidatus Bathyarchaeia archaeon]
GRCPRCKKFILAEQIKTHKCKVKLNGVKELYLDSWVMKDHTNDDGDSLMVAMGLDGYLYRLILCTHNPPHSLKPQVLMDKDRPPDKLPVYPKWGLENLGYWSNLRIDLRPI